MGYNKRINTFQTEEEYEDYINGSIAEAPNIGYVRDTDVVHYTTILPNNYLIFGYTNDPVGEFKIGGMMASSGGLITIHIVENDPYNIMYASESDLPSNLSWVQYICGSYNSFYLKKIVKLGKFKLPTGIKILDTLMMFNGCSALTSLDLSSFDTSNVTTMNSMFSNCSSLTSLDLSNWNTSNVTNMAYMFLNCQSLTSLDLSNWNTSKVTTMASMFSDCRSLTLTLDLSSFDTSNVTTMNSMFRSCKASVIDLSSFDTSNVTDMWGMFDSCTNITSLDISNFDTSKVTNMSSMFSNFASSSAKLNKLILGEGFFKTTTSSISLSIYNWTDKESLAILVDVIPETSTSRTISLSSNTKNALTTALKETITNKGWTIS